MIRIQYLGDVNPENGGYFFETDAIKRGWGYASVVRIVPASDAGLAENEFWIDCLTVNIKDGAALDQALDCVGTTREYLDTLPPASRDALLIDACLSYGYYDMEQSETVRVGKPDANAKRLQEIDVTLRSNACIGRYARRVAREYM